MKNNTCDLVGYASSESAEISLSPKRGCCKMVVFYFLMPGLLMKNIYGLITKTWL
jgi:hypothetical protein